MIRTFHHTDFPLQQVLESKRGAVTVVLPTREVADTVGQVVSTLRALDPLIDQVLVVDSASEDGSADVARAAGAEVHQEAELLPGFGPVLGKGDAMWRALSVARGDVIVFLDSDTRGFPEHFATGVLGPLLIQSGIEFVKGAFRRPFHTGSGQLPDGGGRVTELTARPLLSAFYPELAVFAQPLAGEVGAPRSLLERMPFRTGYGIETQMLLCARELVGTDAMAQVDLDERRNFHQPLHKLGPMAYAVLATVMHHLQSDGRLEAEELAPFRTAGGELLDPDAVERPPMATLRAAA